MLAAFRVALAILVVSGCAEPVGNSGVLPDGLASSDHGDAAAASSPDGAPLSIEEARPIGDYATPVEAPRADNPIGTWYLDTDGARQTLRITSGSELGS